MEQNHVEVIKRLRKQNIGKPNWEKDDVTFVYAIKAIEENKELKEKGYDLSQQIIELVNDKADLEAEFARIKKACSVEEIEKVIKNSIDWSVLFSVWCNHYKNKEEYDKLREKDLNEFAEHYTEALIRHFNGTWRPYMGGDNKQSIIT